MLNLLDIALIILNEQRYSILVGKGAEIQNKVSVRLAVLHRTTCTVHQKRARSWVKKARGEGGAARDNCVQFNGGPHYFR